MNEEKVVGTWIDGKPIYSRTILINPIGNNVDLEVPYNIDNIDKIWINENVSFIENQDEAFSINSFYGVNAYIRTWVNKNLGVIRYKTPADLSSYSGNIILNYTKTTDVGLEG